MYGQFIFLGSHGFAQHDDQGERPSQPRRVGASQRDQDAGITFDKSLEEHHGRKIIHAVTRPSSYEHLPDFKREDSGCGGEPHASTHE